MPQNFKIALGLSLLLLVVGAFMLVLEIKKADSRYYGQEPQQMSEVDKAYLESQGIIRGK